MRTWASSLLLLLAFQASCLRAFGLRLEIWQVPCSRVQADVISETLSRTSAILAPCGIHLLVAPLRPLKDPGAGCDLSGRGRQRQEEIAAMARGPRQALPQGLSLFLLPTGLQARYSSSILDTSAGAGCGDPKDPDMLKRCGIILMTDFAFASGPELSGELLAHEIVHELTMKRHPTHAPKGSILTDHIADMGPKILPEDCVCMQESPFLIP